MIYAHEQREKRTAYVGPRPGYPALCAELWDAMADYLEARRLSFDLAQVNGWYPTRWKGAPRVVIPCSNLAGVPYFQARDMSGKALLRYASPLASRDDSIVLCWPAQRATGTVVVEGPMDALAAAEIGLLGVALMGNQPTVDVLYHLASMVRNFQPVLIVPDLDALDFGPNVLCPLAQYGISGAILVPPKKDIAEMSFHERVRFLRG